MKQPSNKPQDSVHLSFSRHRTATPVTATTFTMSMYSSSSSSSLSSLVLLLSTIINKNVVVIHAQEAMMEMENVIEFDVTGSSTVQFQCTDLISDPDVPFNPRCEFRLTADCESWTCTGSTNQMTYCDSEFFIPGSESDSYRLTQCEEGSTARCDGACT